MSVTRVTQRMLVDGSVGQLQSSLSRLAAVQEQLPTGRVVNRASDAPTEAATAMRLRAEIAQQTQYSRNADNGLSWLATVDTALSGMSDSVRRAREIALPGASSGTAPPSPRPALPPQHDPPPARPSAPPNARSPARPASCRVRRGPRALPPPPRARPGPPRPGGGARGGGRARARVAWGGCGRGGQGCGPVDPGRGGCRAIVGSLATYSCTDCRPA